MEMDRRSLPLVCSGCVVGNVGTQFFPVSGFDGAIYTWDINQYSENNLDYEKVGRYLGYPGIVQDLKDRTENSRASLKQALIYVP